MREIVLDTETTGLDSLGSDRLVEIGCVELINHVASGQVWHCYINPLCSVSEGAFSVHGLSNAFLADKPLFSDIAEDFLAFVGDAQLVIHNASFDMAFLRKELIHSGKEPIDESRVIDSLGLARRKHPNAPASLDALCKRYGIDNSSRSQHGALKDASLLAKVYLELLGGAQTRMPLTSSRREGEGIVTNNRIPMRQRPAPLSFSLSEREEEGHRSVLSRLGEKALWRTYENESPERSTSEGEPSSR